MVNHPNRKKAMNTEHMSYDEKAARATHAAELSRMKRKANKPALDAHKAQLRKARKEAGR